jgi:hypothetical protein
VRLGSPRLQRGRVRRIVYRSGGHLRALVAGRLHRGVRVAWALPRSLASLGRFI